jgi:Tol biopolymer transport system component
MKLLAFVFCAAALVSSAADRILMTRLGPSKASLMIADLDGTGERALTEGTLDYNPAWSADGKWIAFTSERNGSADLYRMHADGSGVERLTDDPSYDDQAAFSPDGDQIVFVSTRAAGTANLWILNVKTKVAHPLTSGQGGPRGRPTESGSRFPPTAKVRCRTPRDAGSICTLWTFI